LSELLGECDGFLLGHRLGSSDGEHRREVGFDRDRRHQRRDVVGGDPASRAVSVADHRHLASRDVKATNRCQMVSWKASDRMTTDRIGDVPKRFSTASLARSIGPRLAHADGGLVRTVRGLEGWL
jgi:hypothetical protein